MDNLVADNNQTPPNTPFSVRFSLSPSESFFLDIKELSDPWMTIVRIPKELIDGVIDPQGTKEKDPAFIPFLRFFFSDGSLVETTSGEFPPYRSRIVRVGRLLSGYRYEQPPGFLLRFKRRPNYFDWSVACRSPLALKSITYRI